MVKYDASIFKVEIPQMTTGCLLFLYQKKLLVALILSVGIQRLQQADESKVPSNRIKGDFFFTEQFSSMSTITQSFVLSTITLPNMRSQKGEFAFNKSENSNNKTMLRPESSLMIPQRALSTSQVYLCVLIAILGRKRRLAFSIETF